MAYRIAQHVIYGEIDNREKATVKAKLWLLGNPKPIIINLKGNCLRDLAGRSMVFYNPYTEKGDLGSFNFSQNGVCGDITASRKVKEPIVPLEDIKEAKAIGKKWFTWVNLLYFEWFSKENGRVVVEMPSFMSAMTTPAWKMTDKEEQAQTEANHGAIRNFMEMLTSFSIKNDKIENREEKEMEKADQVLKQIMRIEKLRQEAQGERELSEDLNLPPFNLDEEEDFYSGLAAIEKPPENTHLENLLKAGISPKKSADIPDEVLEYELWKLIFALAAHNIYINNTNHLSDRELYNLLMDKLVLENAMLPPGTGWNTHIPMDELASDDYDECQEIYMRYYLDDIMREKWEEDFPDMVIPPHEEPKYFRDAFLPTGYEAHGMDIDDE